VDEKLLEEVINFIDSCSPDCSGILLMLNWIKQLLGALKIEIKNRQMLK
jgi:hypothetical protein